MRLECGVVVLDAQQIRAATVMRVTLLNRRRVVWRMHVGGWIMRMGAKMSGCRCKVQQIQYGPKQQMMGYRPSRGN